MKKLQWLLVLIGCFLGILSVKAQVNCFATLDTNEIKIGQPLILRIAVTFPKNGNCTEKPEFKADSTWEVKQTQTWTTTKDQYQTTLQTTYLLTGWEAGKFVIPSFDFEVIYQNRPKSICATSPLNVEIKAPKDIADPVDIKGIVKEPNTWRDYISYLVGIGALLFLALIGIWIYKYRQSKKEIPILQETKLPPYELAMKRIEALKSMAYLEANQQKEFSTDLTYLWREYIENRYSLPALESTSDELFTLLKKNKLDTENLESYKSMLRTTDFIKFANQNTTIEVLQSHMKLIMHFIETTKPDETTI